MENRTKVEEIHEEIDKNQHGGIELLPIVTRGCLCELAKKIGFDHPAEKSYDFTNQVQTFRHIWHEGQIISEVVFLCFNEECILGLRGRQFEGGKCDVIVRVQGCAIFLMVLMFTK